MQTNRLHTYFRVTTLTTGDTLACWDSTRIPRLQVARLLQARREGAALRAQPTSAEAKNAQFPRGILEQFSQESKEEEEGSEEKKHSAGSSTGGGNLQPR